MARVIIFDSGVGGLSIFDQVANRRPGDDYYYLFDNACFPYGELTAEQICQRSLQLLTQASLEFSPDLIVIGCNSASTTVLPLLRENLNIPIVGVVPAIKPAAALTVNGHIGLVATPATVARNYTRQLILDFASDKQVHLLGSTELVHLAELKLAGHTIDIEKLKDVFKTWLSAPVIPDVLVLGCTHFPHLKTEIEALFPGGTQLVDSGLAIANRVDYLLEGKEAGRGERLARYTRDETSVRELQPAFSLRRFSEYGCLAMTSSMDARSLL